MSPKSGNISLLKAINVLHLITDPSFAYLIILSSVAMKATFNLVLLLIFILGLGHSGSCYAQTVATGHVTAEVIESISATSQAVTSLALNTAITNSIQTQGQRSLTSSMINPTTITVNSGNSFTVNVVLKPESGCTTQQTSSTTGTSSIISGTDLNPKSNSSQLQSINGTTNLSDSLLSGQYRGSYTIVFACN